MTSPLAFVSRHEKRYDFANNLRNFLLVANLEYKRKTKTVFVQYVYLKSDGM